MSVAEWRGGRGLQPERTALAWQRTTLGLLGNGGLFALRSEVFGRRSPGDYVIVAALIALAVVSTVVGRRRERLLASATLPMRLTPHREVAVIGWSLAVVCAGTAVVLVLTPG